MLVVFCPFAAGYFLSFFFRNVNAVISKDLAARVRARALGPRLPHRRCTCSPSPRSSCRSACCSTATGRAAWSRRCSASPRPARWCSRWRAISPCSRIGRALIGLGVSAGLMGAIKAFTLWFPLVAPRDAERPVPRRRRHRRAVGDRAGRGAARAVRLARAVLSACARFRSVAALLIFFVVPEKRAARRRRRPCARRSPASAIFASLPFWRIALPLVVCHAGYLALQGLWLGPWLYDVAGQSRAHAWRTTSSSPRLPTRSARCSSA